MLVFASIPVNLRRAVSSLPMAAVRPAAGRSGDPPGRRAALPDPRPCGRTPAVLAFERVAHAATLRAGALIRARFRESQQITFKSEVDLVTAVDREAERLIVEAIVGAFPEHGIVAEESPIRAGSARHRWYVDPLDGTTNFANGYPHFAVSIALAEGDDVLLAVVHDPIREETFAAVRGQGARLAGSPIAVSATPKLDAALVATGFPYDRRAHAAYYLGYWRAVMERARDLRRGGSAALDLCWVASGRLDGFFEWKLRPWDTAAGRLIVAEAGGRVTDFRGGPHRLDDQQTLASNGRIHEELMAALAAGGDFGAVPDDASTRRPT
jgi:myo-inositol-1(or 4)-monophosphatase